MSDTTTWVALLRGINVGTAKRVAMADLRRLLESLGYADVRTLLNSGNAVFTSPGPESAVARAVETAIAGELHMQVRVIVRSGSALAEVVAANPFAASGLDQKRLAVTFLDAEAPVARWRDIQADGYLPDRWAKGDRCVYLYLPNGFSGSNLPDFGKVLGVTATARNWATTTRLSALSGG